MVRNRMVAYAWAVNGIRREVVLEAPIGEVWRALADPDGLSAWFGAEAHGAIAPGAQVRFAFPDGSERAAAIEEVVPERRLAFRWLPFARLPDGSTLARPVTRVEVLLEPEGDATIMRIDEHEPSARLTGAAR